MPSLNFGALRTIWLLACVSLVLAQMLLLSSRFRRIGLLIAAAAWLSVFAAAGLRSEHLNSDTESYVYYADLARTDSIGEYLGEIRLEPGWGLLVHTIAAAGADARANVLLCSLATMILLLISLRRLGLLLGLGMIHYLGEFFLNNDLAVIRHSFATALVMTIVVAIDRGRDQAPSTAQFLRRASLLVPPLFHVATLSALPAAIGVRRSYMQVITYAIVCSLAAWLILYTVGATILPERVMDYAANGNTREVRGFIHLGLLAILVLLNAKAVRSAIENHPAVAFCYLMGLGLSFAVIGFPLLNRLRQVLLEFGILFYPFVLSKVERTARLRVGIGAYLGFIAAVAAYTAVTMSAKYSEGFF